VVNFDHSKHWRYADVYQLTAAVAVAKPAKHLLSDYPNIAKRLMPPRTVGTISFFAGSKVELCRLRQANVEIIQLVKISLDPKRLGLYYR
jgi:hypothetical protein